jgi:hypothetical protein
MIAAMNGTGPRVLAELLVSAVPDLRDRLLADRLRRSWRTVVGPDIARRSQPRGLVNGCLTIAVDNSPWLHELTLRSEELAARLGERFAEVRTLRFVLGGVEAEAAAAPERRPRPRALQPDDVRAIDDAVGEIRDPALRDSARRLLTRARQFDGAGAPR